jgi:hypothetical protein
MGGHSLRQTAQRAAPDAQAGHRRERQERVHRIDALTVEVLGRVDEPPPPNAASGSRLHTT